MSSRSTSPNSSAASIFLLSLASLAQAQITGHVTDAITHQPLEGATVTPMFGSANVPVKTGPDGAYTLSLLPPGTLLLTVTRPGYISIPNDQANPLAIDRVKAGQQLTRDFALTPASAIRIHMTDRDTGKLVPGMSLHIARPGTSIRGVHLPYTGAITTNAQGDAIFPDLASGSFVLWADEQPREFDPAKPAPKRGYGESWYPGVPREDMAVPVTLAPSEQRTLDWHLQQRDLHRVVGTITSDEKIELFATQGWQPFIHGFLPRGGPFEIGGLAEGQWRILFRTASKTFADLDVHLTDRDLEDQMVSLQPASSVSSSIRITETDAPATPNLNLRFVPILPDPRFAPSYTKSVVTDVPPGQYYIGLNGLPATHALTGISVNRVEYPLYAPLSITGGSNLDVVFTVTSRPGGIAGALRDSAGNPVAARLVLRPDPIPHHYDESAIRDISVPASGSFEFRGLAPGRYRAAILKNRGDDPEPDLRNGQLVEVRPGEVTRLDITAK